MGTAYMPIRTPNCPNCGANEWEDSNINKVLVHRCAHCGTVFYIGCSGGTEDKPGTDGVAYVPGTGGAGYTYRGQRDGNAMGMGHY